LLKQVIVIEPGGPNVLFHASRLISVSNEVEGLASDISGNLFYRRSYSWGGKYTLFSAMLSNERRLAPSPQSGPPTPAPSRYLDLPEVDPRIAPLAEQVTAGISDPIEKAIAIERYLKSNYRYSLDLNFPRGVDPLAHFLFEAKAGHCELFASVEAVMLRKLGIPSRIVNGFRRGEFNEWGNDFIVRQSDAHSWVEAYFPGRGWVEFDPTPGSGNESRPPWLAKLTHLFDALDLFWTTEIVSYDFWKQISLFRVIREQISAGSQRADHWLRSLWRITERRWSQPLFASPTIQWRWILWFSAVAGAAWLVFRYRLRFFLFAASLAPSGRSSRVEALLVSRCYLRFLQKLERQGFRRRRGETALELVARIDVETLRAAAGAFTALYYQIRYGSGSDQGIQMLLAALEGI
jgi:hypothetical protein